jgi:hypothetical protein
MAFSRMKTFSRTICSSILAVAFLVQTPVFGRETIESLVKSKNNAVASIVARQLQSDPNTQLADVLSAMKDQSATVQNWLLSVAQSVADRNPTASKQELSQFLQKRSESPTARFWAFDYITRDNPSLRESLLASMLTDPSLELRYEAVALGMKKLSDKGEGDAADKAELAASYQQLLAAARLPSQVTAIAKELRELDVDVNLLKHFGFVPNWKICGQFDNVDGVGFSEAYAPEKDFAAGRLSLEAEYDGKDGTASWQPLSTDADDGALDLNPVFKNAKGAVIYGYTTFQGESDLSCELRIGTPNACKVWLNGEQVIAREVYHTGSQIDQYTAPVKLKAGKNEILVKICQNEQTEPWAQEWMFQVRFTDSTGLAIQPAK